MITFYFSSIILLFFFLLLEFIYITNSLRNIPLRIIVNGTRGKSTTVKLLYNILKKDGKKVFAKITGNDPTVFNPDGTKAILKRFSPASIKENVKLLIQIARQKPDAIIIECMALTPETQKTLGTLILKPHFTIVTNVLPDHKEIMGNRIEENLATILECVYHKSELIVTERTNKLLKTSNIIYDNLINVPEIMFENSFNNIPESIVNESWSIIKETASLLKVDESITTNEFISEWEKINKSIKFYFPKSKTTILNLFSVNDVMTTNKFILHAQNFPNQEKLIFIFNTRIDRPLRTKEFAEYLSEKFPKSTVWIIGNGKQLAKELLFKKNFLKENLLTTSSGEIINKIEKGPPRNTNIYCIGNHKDVDELIEKINFISKQEVTS